MATANYFIYHTTPRSEQDMVSGDPEPPSLEKLESLEAPPRTITNNTQTTVTVIGWDR